MGLIKMKKENISNFSNLIKCKKEGVSELPCIQVNSLTCGFRIEMISLITQGGINL